LAKSSLDRGCRPLLAALRRATVVQCRGGLPLPDKGTVEALAAALRRANVIAEQHLGSGGRLAHVFVARFRFPGVSGEGPFTQEPGALPHPTATIGNIVGSMAPMTSGIGAILSGPLIASNGLRILSWPGLYPSEPVPLPFGQEASQQSQQAQQSQQQQQTHRGAGAGRSNGRRRGGRTQQGDRRGGTQPDPRRSAVELRLAWMRDSILVNLQSSYGARNRRELFLRAPGTTDFASLQADAQSHVDTGGGLRGASGDIEPHLAVDLRSVSGALFISVRGLAVDVDSGWIKGHGVCSVMRDRASAAKALSEGILCVITVRDLPPSVADGSDMARMPWNVHALHLEVSRLQYSAHQHESGR